MGVANEALASIVSQRRLRLVTRQNPAAPATKVPTRDPIELLPHLCLALPGVEEKPFGGHTAPCWRVQDKLFVTTATDSTWMTCKGRPGVQEALLATDGGRYFIPRYTGKSGWIGIRFAAIEDWAEVGELVEESWRMTAQEACSSTRSIDRLIAAPIAPRTAPVIRCRHNEQCTRPNWPS